MWPIRDLSGNVIAFGARKLDADDDGPKYLNTPETSLFRKSTVLYGADLTEREIGQRRQVVIVEGYTDVMSCPPGRGTDRGRDLRHLVRRGPHQGAAPGFMHGHRGVGRESDLHLRRRRGRAAGGPAGVRHGGEVRHPDVRDRGAQRPGPGDLRLAHGNGAVRDLVARRVPLFEFAIKGVLGHHNLNTTEGQLAALDEAASIVAKIKAQGRAPGTRSTWTAGWG